jgi:hypothetical protein
MTDATVYKVKVTLGDKSCYLDMDMIVYNVLSSNTAEIEFIQGDGKVIVKLKNYSNIYLFPTTQEVADILSGDYSIEIV